MKLDISAMGSGRIGARTETIVRLLREFAAKSFLLVQVGHDRKGPHGTCEVLKNGFPWRIILPRRLGPLLSSFYRLCLHRLRMNLFRGELCRRVGVRRRRTIVLPRTDNSPVRPRQNKVSRHGYVTEIVQKT